MKVFIAILFLITVTFSCNSENKGNELSIAVAANMKVPMDSIAEVFSAETGIQCKLYSNSSGTINAQIEQGAPYDIFVSANTRYPLNLSKKNIASNPILYGKGTLVLVAHKDFDTENLYDILLQPGIKKIAIAFPENAPYGKAAMEVIDNIGLSNSLEEKIVFGESISQVNQLFASKAVDAAFTSYSFIMDYTKKHFSHVVLSDLYTDINQSAVLILDKDKQKTTQQEKFMTFLISDKCKSILQYFGYQKAE